MYWADFFVDTASFDAERTGVYVSLLGHAWMRGGWLVDDDDELSRLARCTPEQWAKHRAKLSAKPYFVVKDGKWIQKRLTAEYAKAAAMYQSAVDNGKRGGRPRKTQTKPGGYAGDNRADNRPANRAGNPDPNPNLTQRKHNHNSQPTKYERQEQGAVAPSGVNADTWEAWVQRKGKRQTAAADRLQRKHLSEWQAEGHDPNRIVESAVANGWQGLHAPAQRINGKGPTSLAERRTATIDRIVNGTTGGGSHDNERDISGTARRLDSEAPESLPVDLRESGGTGIRRRG